MHHVHKQRFYQRLLYQSDPPIFIIYSLSIIGPPATCTAPAAASLPRHGISN